MRKLVVAYAAMFAVGSYAGHSHGRAYLAQPAVIEQHAFKEVNVVLADNPDPKREGKKVMYLVYARDGATLYRFNVGTDELERTTDLAAVELQNPTVLWDQPGNSTVLAVFVGGPAIGYALKDVVAKWEGTRRQQIVAGVLGAASGYTVGYSFAVRRLPGPESAEVRAVLNDREKWKAHKPRMFRAICARGYQLTTLGRDPARAARCRALLETLYSRSQRDDFAFDPVHFLMLHEVYTDALELAREADPDAGTSASDDSKPFYLRWWGVLLIVVASLLGLAGIAYWLRKAESPRAAVTPPPGPGRTNTIDSFSPIPPPGDPPPPPTAP